MARGQQKGNREVRKPKFLKIKTPSTQDTPFAIRSGLTATSKPGGKKQK
jgi:hypothetical protein